MICHSASAVLLLTGYWPVMGASVVVFTKEGGVHVVLPEDEVELAQRTSDASLIPYQPGSSAALTATIDAIADPLGRVTRQLGLRNATISLQFGEGMQAASYASSYHFGSSLLGLLQRLLPKANYRSCDNDLKQMEGCKSQKELKAIATGLGDRGCGI